MTSRIRILSVFVFGIAAAADSHRISPPIELCFQERTLRDFTSCWSTFIPEKITKAELGNSLPTPRQRADWQHLITALLLSSSSSSSSSQNDALLSCAQQIVPSSFRKFYRIRTFVDETENNAAKFCILYEISSSSRTDDGKGFFFVKGWGLFVVPFSTIDAPRERSILLRNVHYSVAHPISDGPVQLQAGYLFARTRARSLLVTGFRRDSSSVRSHCQRKEASVDVAHDNSTMFHSALIAIKNWQFLGKSAEEAARSSDSADCAFIQFHGKASTTCVNETIFLTTGYSRKDSIVYTSNPGLPVNRLKLSLRRNSATGNNWTIRTPDEESGCSLSATTNIFGRLLNGVPVGEECEKKATPDHASGYFIHAEQSMEAREIGAYDIWARSILETFGAVSRGASGQGEDNTTLRVFGYSFLLVTGIITLLFSYVCVCIC